MSIRFSQDCVKDLKKIKSSDSKLFRLIGTKLNLFKNNPSHPSLRTHKLGGKLDNMWSLSVNLSIRMVFLRLSNDEFYFVAVGSHQKVYG
jgi:addiction module RelE/StbE family toxin